MQRSLTVQEATVQTVQVEIQALKVGKKQVTMGLFRQLPHEPLIDPETVQLRGVPWGHVRYWWDGDGSGLRQGPKLHVVWPHGHELRRAIVHAEPSPPQMGAFEGQIEAAFKDWSLAALQAAQSFEVQRRASAWTGQREVTVNGHTYTTSFEEKEWYAMEAFWIWRDKDPVAEADASIQYMRRVARYTEADIAEALGQAHAQATRDKEAALEGYRALLQAYGLLHMPPATILQTIHTIHGERETYKAQWAKQWQTLSQLPQLFIAV